MSLLPITVIMFLLAHSASERSPIGSGRTCSWPAARWSPAVGPAAARSRIGRRARTYLTKVLPGHRSCSASGSRRRSRRSRRPCSARSSRATRASRAGSTTSVARVAGLLAIAALGAARQRQLPAPARPTTWPNSARAERAGAARLATRRRTGRSSSTAQRGACGRTAAWSTTALVDASVHAFRIGMRDRRRRSRSFGGIDRADRDRESPPARARARTVRAARSAERARTGASADDRCQRWRSMPSVAVARLARRQTEQAGKRSARNGSPATVESGRCERSSGQPTSPASSLHQVGEADRGSRAGVPAPGPAGDLAGDRRRSMIATRPAGGGSGSQLDQARQSAVGLRVDRAGPREDCAATDRLRDQPAHDIRYCIASVGSENSISASSVATMRP